MAGLCWMAVVLAFSTSIGNSLAVDQSTLTDIVGEILDRYFMKNMQFSLAVNIPVDQKKIMDALNKDASKEVEKMVSDGKVYIGTNVVAAQKQGVEKYGKKFTEHAEARVLDNIKPLADKSKDHILVLYSFLSPCGDKCTNQENKFNILNKINKAIENSNWADHAFVFTTVFSEVDGTPIPIDEIKGTLDKLRKTLIGHDKIFRCYFPSKDKNCVQCFTTEGLSDECVKN